MLKMTLGSVNDVPLQACRKHVIEEVHNLLTTEKFGSSFFTKHVMSASDVWCVLLRCESYKEASFSSVCCGETFMLENWIGKPGSGW